MSECTYCFNLTFLYHSYLLLLAKSEDTKASEKIDVSNQTIGGIKVRWEWEDTGKWVIFATIHQEEILKALDAKLTSVCSIIYEFVELRMI